MPKLKTCRGARKRLKFTGSGKIKRRRAHLRHILTSKTKSQKARLATSALVSKEDVGRMERLMPYG